MQRVLSFDQTPPMSVPLRFILSAPLFALAGALLLLWQGEDAMSSRWAPATLALTHLLTLGFLSMSMIGSLLQILPVAAGVALPRLRLCATIVHGLLCAGTLVLACAFLLVRAPLFQLALALLVPAFLWLLATLAIGLWRARIAVTTATVQAVRISLAALALTILFGAALGAAFAWPLVLPLVQLVDLHVLWGLAGWVCLLVMGVAYQVIPMFQVTALYPRKLTRWLVPAMLLLLILWSSAALLWPDQSSWLAPVAAAMILAAFMVFAAATFHLLRNRKRPADATTMFWRTALASLFCCALIWLVPGPAPVLMLGVLFIVGFAGSAISGMFYKIVPFLVWYHLQNSAAGGSGLVPNVRQILPDRFAVRQCWAHRAALLLLTIATVWPHALAQVAAVALGLSSGWLWINLFNATRLYRRVLRSVKSALVTP